MASTTAFATWAFAFANAHHHVGARCLGSGLHHISTGRPARAAPQGLATHGNGFCFLTGLRAKAFQNLNGYFLLGEAFDFHHEPFFVQTHQTHGFTAGARAASSANAVNVVF